MSETINETVGKVRTHGELKARCQICGEWKVHAELNWEALIHHNARRLECLDRKTCERKKRKTEKKTPPRQKGRSRSR